MGQPANRPEMRRFSQVSERLYTDVVLLEMFSDGGDELHRQVVHSDVEVPLRLAYSPVFMCLSGPKFPRR
jgi:hypothetical protein